MLLVVTENKECPFLMSPNECEKYLFKKKYFRAVYRACAYWHLFFFKSIIYITILNHRYNSQQDAWAVCAQIVDFLYKYTVFRAKKSEIRPIHQIRPISNVHAHTIGIVFSPSKPIGIKYCFDDMWNKRLRPNGARLKDWIYWWTIEFIQFNFSIAHWWRKDGCQRVYELGLDQLSSYLDILLSHRIQPLSLTFFTPFYKGTPPIRPSVGW